ncbi:MAG: hypothetical protein M3P23_08755, partial [Actinomycetota bacterium]|nr:hypothetical protein [Actinomycetota bacterium]
MTKGDTEAQLVMVDESAAAIMARPVPVRVRALWPVLAGLAAAVVVIGLVAVVVVNRPRSISLPADATRQTVSLTGVSAPETRAAHGALAAYHGYLTAYAVAGQTANAHDARLNRYATDPALLQTQITLLTMAESGLAYRGGFKGVVRVTSVSLKTQT